MVKIKKIMSSLLSVLITSNYLITGGAAAFDFEKRFDFIDEISVNSMLPLEEKKAYLVAGGDSYTDISDVPVNLVLDNLLDSDGNHIEISENAKVVWSYYKDTENNVISDDYFVLDRGGTLDLSIFEEYEQYVLEMIVGDGNQLNPDNVRYIVTVYLSDVIQELRTYELYTQEGDGTRHKTEPTGISTMSSIVQVAGMDYSTRRFLVPDHKEGENYYIGVNSPLDEHPFIKLDVITFDEYYKYMVAQAKGEKYEYSTINGQILNQNMGNTDAGYKTNLDSSDADNLGSILKNALYFIYRNETTGEIIRADCVKFLVDGSFSRFTDEAYDIDFNDVRLNESETTISAPSDIKISGSQVTDADAITVNKVWLKKGYSPDDEYYYRLNAYSDVSENVNGHVIKAVRGLYSSPENAEDAEDIKEQLIPADSSVKGYRANYSAESRTFFTVFFDDGSVFQFLVIFNEYNPAVDTDYIREYSDVPVIGEADPWFRVTGAKDENGNVLDTYSIENGKNINIDTMYGYGYQAIFINDDVTCIEPTFWTANSDYISVESIYADGRRFNAGDTINFPDNGDSVNAVFSVVINDSRGRHTKNYNVSFIKRTGGARLYVAGPSSPDVRSVFLDEYFEYKHDIFIANTGSTPLTDLRVELDAENVRLDSYWTIGGDGNNTLLPCSDNFSAEMASTKYGELSNVSKIRLVPDGDGGGEISGTLKIYSGSDLLEEIILSGMAQNPEIITPEIDDAVLYVPYSYLVTTNNMYDWTTVDFEISGNLPDGVEFYPETGEIYGVPLETGDFTFSITANFTSDTYSFDSSTATYTMTVKENTNYNVYMSTDNDYTLLDTIGTDVGGYDFVIDEISDGLFRSEGVLDRFVGLWLNGELLEEGVDYDAESGSTKITVYAQTFEDKANRDGINTIAAEFRTTDTESLNTLKNTNELKVTAQNFRLDLNHDAESQDVTCSVKILDPNGGSVPDIRLELRSEPQNAVTDSAGVAEFRPIGFGRHTLYVRDDDNNITAQKSFEITSGSKYGVKGDTVTAAKGSSFTLEVEYDGKRLTLITTEKDEDKKNNSAGDRNNNVNNVAFVSRKNENGESTLISVPDTGDGFNIRKLFSLFLSAFSLMIISLFCKKIKNHKE